MRATPARGESAITTFFMADPGVPAPLEYALAVCQRDETLTGIPGCAGGAIASAFGSGTPTLPFVVPAALPPGERLLVLGVICGNGTPSTTDVVAHWPHGLSCQGASAQGSRVQFDVFLRPEYENENPTLSDETIQIDGEVWDAALPVDGALACDGSERAVSANGATHQLRVGVSVDDRETSAGSVELSELSSFSNGGELSRAFSFIEAGSAADAVSLEWRAPSSAPTGGRRVRFYFVLRDGRGGADLSERVLCVVP
jgi:hypothetical protein